MHRKLDQDDLVTNRSLTAMAQLAVESSCARSQMGRDTRATVPSLVIGSYSGLLRDKRPETRGREKVSTEKSRKLHTAQERLAL